MLFAGQRVRPMHLPRGARRQVRNMRPPISGQPPQAPGPGPTPPVGSQIPGAGIYLQQQAGAEQAYQNALNNIEHQRGETIRNYGFLPGGGVDPNNNYGMIQNLWRQQASTANEQDLGLLGRGIRGGLAGQAMAQRKVAEGGQNLELQRGYDSSMYDLGQQRLQAESEHNAAMLQAQQEAAQNAQQNENYTPAIVPEEPPALPNQQQARQNHARRAVRQRQRRGRRR